MDRRQVVVAFDTLSGAARPDRTAGDAIVPLFDETVSTRDALLDEGGVVSMAPAH
jgi:hypothetical protein